MNRPPALPGVTLTDLYIGRRPMEVVIQRYLEQLPGPMKEFRAERELNRPSSSDLTGRGLPRASTEPEPLDRGRTSPSAARAFGGGGNRPGRPPPPGRRSVGATNKPMLQAPSTTGVRTHPRLSTLRYPRAEKQERGLRTR